MEFNMRAQQKGYSEFGIWMRRMRQKKGISCASLGKLIGVSKAYISSVELGRSYLPSEERLKQIAKYLDIPEEEIIIKASIYKKDANRQNKSFTTHSNRVFEIIKRSAKLNDEALGILASHAQELAKKKKYTVDAQ